MKTSIIDIVWSVISKLSLPAKMTIIMMATILGSAIISPQSALALIISNPDDSKISVLGVHPDPPLVEHIPLGNTLSFELDFVNIDTANLNFTEGKVRYFDVNGNQILPEETIDLNLFEMVAVRSGGDDPANNGEITPNQRVFLFFPFENLPHNVVPATIDIDLFFVEFVAPLSFRDIAIKEYHAPPGQTYIYPVGQMPTIEPMSNWVSGQGHELTTNHRQDGLRSNSTTAWGNQRYAYDIGVEKSGVGSCNPGPGPDPAKCEENEDFFCWEEPLYAMADGIVALIIKGYADNPKPSDDMNDNFTPGAGECNNEPTAGLCNGTAQFPWPCALNQFPGSGNQVVLLHPNGEYSTYAHMMQGSNDDLDCGDFVAQGDEIGKIGMTGTGSNPHNHFSTLTTPGPEAQEAENYPIYFNNIKFPTAGAGTSEKLQLDVSLPSGTLITEILLPPSPVPSNPASPPGTVAEVEPNNTVADHQTLSLPTLVEGNLETGDVSTIAVRGDGIEDIYRVNRGSPSMIQADLFGFDPGQNLDVYGMTENHRVLNPVHEGTSEGLNETLCLSVDAGAYYLMVTNADQAPASDTDYFLDVTAGDAPIITIPGDVDFGETCIESTQTQTLHVCNTGGDTGSCVLEIDEITSTFPEFSVTPPSSGYPVRISSDFCFPFQVTFNPEFEGQRSTELIIPSNDPLNPEVRVRMTGIGTQPDLNTAIANSGDFGKVCKTDHADLNLTLFNQGKCDLTISDISILQNGNSFVLPANVNYPLVLSPDADFTLPIRYAPSGCNDIGENAKVVITSDDPNNEGIMEIGISGSSPCPNLIIDPAALTGLYAFPATVVDKTGTLGCSSERMVTLRNNSECPLTITDITAAGQDFTVTAPTVFPVLLPSGEETLEVAIQFTPQSDLNPLAPSALTGSLTIVSDDPGPAQPANLCGESVAQSGVRLLVTEVSSGSPVPVDEVDSITIQSKGKKTPSPINLQFFDQPLSSANICGNDIYYHVDQETLPEVGTTGSNPKSSYSTKAMEGNLQTSESFSLGQCEFRDFQLELFDSNSNICLLLPKGDSCTTAGECCSGKCKGPEGNKTCK
jgi:hypothetical protein